MAKGLKRKNINFYSAFYKKPALDRAQLKRDALIVTPVALLLICLLVTGVMYCQIFYATMKAEEINTALKAVDIQEAVDAANALTGEIDTAQTQKSYLTGMEKIIASYPEFSDDVFSKITATATGDTVYNSISYDAGSGVLTIGAEAPEMDDAAKSASALRSMKTFSGVQYQGYSSGADEVYVFEIYCIMEGGEGE